MITQKITVGFILLSICVIAVYDFWAYSQAGTEGTISWVMYGWSHDYPAFTFAMGFVMGHLFWQMKKKKE